MIKVAVLTAGLHTPSSRFRVRQHIPLLEEHGVSVTEYIPAIQKDKPVPGLPKSIKPRYVLPVYLPWIAVKAMTRLPGMIGSWQSQVTWLERELIPGNYTVEGFLKKPIVFDVDDAIWAKGILAEKTSQKLAEQSEIVIAGNEYLANWYGQFTNNIRIVPTAVDTERFYPQQGDSDRFIIGWTGTHGNLQYLEEIEPVFKRLMNLHQDIVIHVVCNRPPNFPKLDENRVVFVPWTPENEAHLVQNMNVGIMPLPDNEWTRGKCSFKMLQYMSCGIPVVVSPVGMNATVLQQDEVGFAAITHDEWFEHLLQYYQNPALAHKHGQAGRNLVEKHYSRKVVAAALAAIFKEFE